MMSEFLGGTMTQHRLWVGLVVLTCVGVSACTPDPVETPSPTPSVVVSTSTPSPTATPTPQWTAEEQAAIDTVLAYINVWNTISHDPAANDPETIRQYAIDPVAAGDIAQLTQWRDDGWHIEGTPQFTPAHVEMRVNDESKFQYYVYGCYSIVGTDLVDKDGASQTRTDRQDFGGNMYTTVDVDGVEYVVGIKRVEGWC